jgi:GTPase
MRVKESFVDRHKGGERALLLFVYQDDLSDREEFEALCDSAALKTIHSQAVRRQRFSSKFLIGSGKVDELGAIIKAENIEVVIVNKPLTPAQGRNLEEVWCCRVLDRTELILDIFAQRARSYEGRLQVELAQLQHLMSRLVRGWTHLERQKGGIGLRGPGETQLETDKRLLAARVKSIKKKLEKVKSQRIQSRRGRQRAEIPTVSLVGYTNAGKSTLFNRLTGAEVYAKDQLFATLDPTLRQVVLPNLGKIILADTVGFIRDLPHDLIDAFHATLEEVCHADLLLHVVDVSDPHADEMIEAVNAVLEAIGASDVPQLLIYNKIDCLPSAGARIDSTDALAERIWVSAHKEQGLDLLVEGISGRLACPRIRKEIRLLPTEGRLRAQLYEDEVVQSEALDDTGAWLLEVDMPAADFNRLIAIKLHSK